MRLPRMTTRRWIIAVAIVGLVLGSILHRRQQFLNLAEYRRSRSTGVHRVVAMRRSDRVCVVYRRDARGRTLSPLEIRKHPWQVELSAKYLRAARYPWFLAGPDPPEPE